jgi:hypothetical protein
MTTLRGPAILRALCCAGALVAATPATAQWRIDGGAEPRALSTDAAGNEVSVYRDHAGQVYLEFRPQGGFSRLARNSCPTFQIDRRTPLNHPALGAGCLIEDNRAIYTLATLSDRTLVSRPVYDLMNGNRVAFRYLTENGAYREHVFSLERSADAIRGALRRDLRIRAE